MGGTRVLFLIAAGLLAAPAAAQAYERPRLDAGSDTLDPRAYWDLGNRPEVSWDRTRDARYWAWRLAPNTTDYLYGVYLALFFRQPPPWRRAFRAGSGEVMGSQEARVIDSLWSEVVQRDPFPALEGPCDRPPGIEDLAARDPLLAAVVLFEGNCHQQALPRFTTAIARHPELLWVRIARARSQFYRRQYRAAAADLMVVLDSLRARDAQYLTRVYQSKAFLEYAVGVALQRGHDRRGARAAFGRALTEDLTYGPAHARLADVAAAEGRLSEAAAEYELAVGLKPDDGVRRFRYGVVLLRAGRLPEAEVQLAEAVRLEPYWHEPYGQLALALDRQGKAAQAMAMYRAYAARVPRRLSHRRDTALARIRALARLLDATDRLPSQHPLPQP